MGTINIDIPSARPNLDHIAPYLGLARLPGESDDDLAARILAMMNPPWPHPVVMRLFHFLAKLGLQSPRKHLPIGLEY